MARVMEATTSNNLDPNIVGDWLRDGKAAIDFLRGVVSLLPKGVDRNRAAEQVEQAETALKKSEAAVAKDLGFALCQCTFPPQIMLWKEADKAHVCPRAECGHAIHRGMKISAEMLNRSRGANSWMGR